MEQFFSFFIIVLAAVIFSTAFKQLHIPWVITLIFAGIVIGPHTLGFIELNPTIEFIGQIGLVFLMFMAGLETKLEGIREFKKEIFVIASLNGLLPFAVGVSIGLYFGYALTSAILLGIIFVSSSIAIIIPSLEARGLMFTRVGKSIVASTVVEDMASLIALSVLIQTTNPITALPLFIFYPLLFAVLVLLRWLLPKIERFLASGKDEKDIFQHELRSVVLVLIGTVIIFELLGLHPIIAGFFAGLVLSGVIAAESLKNKLYTLGYGLFIPIFFVLVGAKIDIAVFRDSFGAFVLVGIVIAGSILSKFISGWLAGRLLSFDARESALIGAASIPQLSTTLAVVFAGVELGLLEENLIAAMVALSVATVFFAPLLMGLFSREYGVRAAPQTPA